MIYPALELSPLQLSTSEKVNGDIFRVILVFGSTKSNIQPVGARAMAEGFVEFQEWFLYIYVWFSSSIILARRNQAVSHTSG